MNYECALKKNYEEMKERKYVMKWQISWLKKNIYIYKIKKNE